MTAPNERGSACSCIKFPETQQEARSATEIPFCTIVRSKNPRGRIEDNNSAFLVTLDLSAFAFICYDATNFQPRSSKPLFMIVSRTLGFCLDVESLAFPTARSRLGLQYYCHQGARLRYRCGDVLQRTQGTCGSPLSLLPSYCSTPVGKGRHQWSCSSSQSASPAPSWAAVRSFDAAVNIPPSSDKHEAVWSAGPQRTPGVAWCNIYSLPRIFKGSFLSDPGVLIQICAGLTSGRV